MAEEATKEGVTSLECGTSLAEREHCTAHHGAQPSSLKAPEMADGTISSVSDLRSTLALDALTSGGGIQTFVSPFEVSEGGRRNLIVPLVYCDQTASNRPVRSIERYMQETCLPLYGNTHTNTSITGSQSTAFVAEARQIVAEATNAKITGKASLDVVLFAGNGTTSAVELLIDCLGLKHASSIDKSTRPVVFIGPYEHHSNLVPWRESGCEIVMVAESAETCSVDLIALEKLLTKPEYANRLKMGTFSAASNVNGKISDVDAIAATLHQHGALAFFDYATGAPYMPMNMNPPPSTQYPSPSLVAKDAIFLSPHKMLGGVGTPGVLIVKKHLVNQVNAPARSGGGTVFYVTNTHHRFLSNRIERYEGGTPNISGIMRTGLTFLLKRKAEEKYALVRERVSDETLPPSLFDFDCTTYNYVVKSLSERAPNLVILGDHASGRHLPIFSFLIRCGRRFLHYNYVCALLNDVFGIQSRGGCQCSGPYSQRLLGLTEIDCDGSEVPNERNLQVEHALMNYKERAEVLRPGFTRLSLPFKGVREEEVEYVINALEWIAKNGWSLMCQYRCNHRTGEWRHASRQGKPLGRTERKWLSHYDMIRRASVVQATDGKVSNVQDVLNEALANADTLLEDARSDQPSLAQALKMVSADVSGGSNDDFIERLRWFVYPKECAVWISQGRSSAPETESENVLGALRPLQSVAQVSQAVACSEDNTTSSLGEIKVPETHKRKLPDAPDDSPVLSVVRNEESTGEDRTNKADSSTVFAFRDVEHQGEAVLDEIVSGYDDGELSDLCQIYDPEADAWLSIGKYISSGDIVGAKSAKNESPSHTEHEAVKHKQESALPIVSPAVLMTDAANQRKKPQRDSRAWGSTASAPDDIRLAPSIAVPTTDQEAVDGLPLSAPNRATAKMNKRGRYVKPPAKLMRYIIQAIFQWNMLEEGDRLLLGLSGGKDSLSLLHCLLDLQRKLPINFEIEVCTIDPMTPSFDPSPLIPYVESLGLKYHYIKDDIVARASTSGKGKNVVSSLCAFCARMKRGNLYTTARRNNCNKLVLAQHLDDCAESFLMSVMHNGFLRTMKANYQINAGDLSVIRPMVYCRESLMTDFAKASNLPVINENCPACFEEPKERARIKKLLAREEILFPNLHDNIRRSLIPLMHDDSTAILRCYLEETLARGKKDTGQNLGGKGRKGKRAAATEEEKKGDHEETGTKMPDASSEAEHDQKRLKTCLAEASEEDLVKELAKRKAERFRLAGAMKRLEDDGGPVDPTGQVCTLNGGDGSIPCRELME